VNATVLVELSFDQGWGSLWGEADGGREGRDQGAVDRWAGGALDRPRGGCAVFDGAWPSERADPPGATGADTSQVHRQSVRPTRRVVELVPVVDGLGEGLPRQPSASAVSPTIGKRTSA